MYWIHSLAYRCTVHYTAHSSQAANDNEIIYCLRKYKAQRRRKEPTISRRGEGHTECRPTPIDTRGENEQDVHDVYASQ